MNNEIKLSDHFNFKTILKFTMPTIIMMVVLSVYGIVDGFFVSNYVGKNEFAAINLVWPVINMLGVVGFMFGTGGSALVGRKLGQGYDKDAREIFTMIVFVMLFLGAAFSVAGIAFMPRIVRILGATDIMLEDSILYGRIVVAANAFFVLQFSFQSLMITAERPRMGLWVSVAAGVTNIVFDYLLVYVFSFGTAGAAVATAMSEVVGGAIPFLYFFKKHGDCKLHYVKFKMRWNDLIKAATNGMSEMLTTLSSSLVSMVYNIQLLKFAQENGVAAYGVIMYVIFIFLSVFIGYAQGMAPVISFNYGADNRTELKGIFKRSLAIVTIYAIAMLICSQAMAYPFAKLYVGYDEQLMAMTVTGLKLYSLSFLIAGFNIFASAFFTALNNGALSAVISFSRTLVFQMAAVMILPILIGLNGIWLSVAVAELLSIFISIILLAFNRKRYGYL